MRKQTIWFYQFKWVDNIAISLGFVSHYGNYIGTKKDFDEMTKEAHEKHGFFY